MTLHLDNLHQLIQVRAPIRRDKHQRQTGPAGLLPQGTRGGGDDILIPFAEPDARSRAALRRGGSHGKNGAAEVPGTGLEPARITPPDPKSGASTNFAILA